MSLAFSVCVFVTMHFICIFACPYNEMLELLARHLQDAESSMTITRLFTWTKAEFMQICRSHSKLHFSSPQSYKLNKCQYSIYSPFEGTVAVCVCVCAFNSCGIVKISRARQNNVQRLRANLMLIHSYCSKGISCSLTKFNFHNQFKQVIIDMFYEAQKPLSIYIMKLNEKKCI